MLLAVFIFFMYTTPVMAAGANDAATQKLMQMAANAKPIELAFVFDGPSDKNKVVLE